jgi:hypothetical protein
MSHNKFKINNKEPDSNGNYNINISDMADVNITNPVTNDVLKYDGTEWLNQALTGSTAEYVLVGQGETSSYTNSSVGSNTSAISPTNAQYIRLYDTSPLNTINNSSINSDSGGGSDWYESITLPTGLYMVLVNVKVSFTASGYFGFNVCDTSNNTILSQSALIGSTANSHAPSSATNINSYLNLSSQTTIGIKCHVSSNVDSPANQGNDISEYSSILIFKI